MTSRLFVLLTIATIPGCGGPSRPQTATVEGVVTFDGVPIKQGTIVFESAGNRPANGRIEDGRIVGVTTFEENDGVIVGEHKVAVFALEDASDAVSNDPSQDTSSSANYMGAGPSLLPKKYGDPSTSGLSVVIQKGDNHIALELEK